MYDRSDAKIAHNTFKEDYFGILYGCALMQTYVYYELFPKDSWKTQDPARDPATLAVAATPTQLAGQSIRVSRLLNAQALRNMNPWHIFIFSHDYSDNVYYMTSQLGPLLIALVLSGILCGCALVQTYVYYKLFPKDNWKFKTLPWQWFIVSTLFITICADTVIAVSMSYYLKASEAGFRRTSRVVDRMILYIMATGIITSTTIVLTESPASISALASGVSFLITPNVFIWLGLIMAESGYLIGPDALLLEYTPTHSWQPAHLARVDGQCAITEKPTCMDILTQTIVRTAPKEIQEADNGECTEFEGGSKLYKLRTDTSHPYRVLYIHLSAFCFCGRKRLSQYILFRGLISFGFDLHGIFYPSAGATAS
ncbi:hypothetical protein BKA82DRAFT_4012950 [Pisolithus tinctorius]|nr:hypothetical protein BKA82DRAFT_4012950 [Pisolithus tinctorius]